MINFFFFGRSLDRLDEMRKNHFSIALLITKSKVKISRVLFSFTHSAIEIINFVHKAKHNLQEIRERVVKSWQVIYMEGIHEQKFVRIYLFHLHI